MNFMKKSIIIAIIVAVVVGGGMFYAGTVYKKSSLNKQGLLRSAASFGNRQGGQSGANGQRPGGQNGQGRGQGGGFQSGEITAKENNSLTIKDRDGSSVIVFFSDSTTISKSVDGSAADLNNGQQVMVSGQANSDGTYTAQNIQIRPADSTLPGQ